MYEWHTVSSQADIDRLCAYFNDFHDVYIKSVLYKSDIVSNGVFTALGALNGSDLQTLDWQLVDLPLRCPKTFTVRKSCFIPLSIWSAADFFLR